MTVAVEKIESFEQLIGELPHERIGIVTSGEILIDEDFWESIDTWKEKYDTAIEKYLSNEESGDALTAI